MGVEDEGGLEKDVRVSEIVQHGIGRGEYNSLAMASIDVEFQNASIDFITS